MIGIDTTQTQFNIFKTKYNPINVLWVNPLNLNSMKYVYNKNMLEMVL